MMPRKASDIEPGTFIAVIASLENPRDENHPIEVRLYARVERNDRRARQLVLTMAASTEQERFVFGYDGIEVDETTKGLTARLELPTFVGTIDKEALSGA